MTNGPIPKEEDLLKGFDAYTAHADEAAEPLPNELTPAERLNGSVIRYERPSGPVEDWEYSEVFDDGPGRGS